MVRSAQPGGRGPPAYVRRAICAERLDALGQLVVAADVLRRLDDLREQAFARRDVRLLARVYVPGRLLDEDGAPLRRLVPVGCGLVGAHTEFRNVQGSVPAAGRWSVRATARLAPSTLRCNGVANGHAAGAGPTGLRIELARVRGQYRIAGQLPG